jgi:hypothetical protein
VEVFVQKIGSKAVAKKIETDQQQKTGVSKEGVDLAENSEGERLGPGGLDPLARGY